MKSILVDALRQANGDDPDQALSDSGSFDATQEDFGVIANDANDANDASADEAGELALMSTTSALVVREEVPDELPAELGEQVSDDFAVEVANEESTIEVMEENLDALPVDDEHAMTIVGMVTTPVRIQQMPLLAKISPLLCVLLAAAVAGCWLLYQTYVTSRPGVGLGAVVSQPRTHEAPDVAGDNPVVAAETRFPFLEIGKPIEMQGKVE